MTRALIDTECERVFSSAKKLITPERNTLAEDIIEALRMPEGLVEKRSD
jgi:hypothetical protein